MQIKIIHGGNVIADAEFEKTATSDGAADYKGWLVEAGISGGSRRRAFTATGVDRSKGSWRTLLQVLVEAHRELMSPQEFRDLIRGPRLCRARKHPRRASGPCQGCREDRRVEVEAGRRARAKAAAAARIQQRIDKLADQLAAAKRDLEIVGSAGPLNLPAPREKQPRSEAQHLASIASAAIMRERREAKRAAREAAAVASG